MQVRRLRKAAGLTQEVTAQKCGIFRTYLSRIEAGSANPTIAVLLVLAEVLNVKITDLFEE
jgi:transcriptional regulator with XRE-family HTH domain